MIKYLLLDFSKPMVLHTNASNVGIVEDGVHRLLAFRLRKLSEAEKRYQVHEKETLSLAETMEEWRHYFFGAYFAVHTGNFELSYLQKNQHPSAGHVS